MKKIVIVVIALIIVLAAILFLMPKDSTKSAQNDVSNPNGTNKENLSNESSQKENMTNEGDEEMNKINIRINGIDFTATLEDNETSRALLTKLPLEISMDELNGNEKYYYFEDSLPSNATNVDAIENGDIMLYGSDCLVIFYESFNTSYSYTRIGKIDNPSSLKDALGSGSVNILITK